MLKYCRVQTAARHRYSHGLDLGCHERHGTPTIWALPCASAGEQAHVRQICPRGLLRSAHLGQHALVIQRKQGREDLFSRQVSRGAHHHNRQRAAVPVLRLQAVRLSTAQWIMKLLLLSPLRHAEVSVSPCCCSSSTHSTWCADHSEAAVQSADAQGYPAAPGLGE
jgi:hypothetical protein